jgi:hypothetical protein
MLTAAVGPAICDKANLAPKWLGKTRLLNTKDIGRQDNQYKIFISWAL